MARARTSSNGKPSTVMGEFRRILLNNPRWIKIRSNKRTIEQYLQSFPGRSTLTAKEKGALANVKSALRNKKNRGRKKADEMNGAAPKAVKVKAADLITLEYGIDDCYSLARKLDPVGLANVIHLLRKARNEIIAKE